MICDLETYVYLYSPCSRLYPEINIIREMSSSVLGERSVTFVFPSALLKRFAGHFASGRFSKFLLEIFEISTKKYFERLKYERDEFEMFLVR